MVLLQLDDSRLCYSALRNIVIYQNETFFTWDKCSNKTWCLHLMETYCFNFLFDDYLEQFGLINLTSLNRLAVPQKSLSPSEPIPNKFLNGRLVEKDGLDQFRYQWSEDSNSGQLGGKREKYLCATRLPITYKAI